MPLAAPPPSGTETPALLAAWADGHDRAVAELVWRNELGGITARLVGDDVKDLYAKWSPVDLEPEAERMSWLSGRHPSPRVFDYVDDGDEWLLVTGALRGTSAVSPRWKADPDRAAAAIGEGLAMLHSLDPSMSMFGPVDWVGVRDDVDLLVIAHGDACVPNTIIGDDGRFVGHVDLGDLGVADRWADLAIASWSLEWDFGPGHEAAFWDAYGIEPDLERIAVYRGLWGEPGDSGSAPCPAADPAVPHRRAPTASGAPRWRRPGSAPPPGTRQASPCTASRQPTPRRRSPPLPPRRVGGGCLS